ncbi:hypothetical protein K474DRAFT_1672541 [Panus rudis PR-1116 ss-1]|nr:hypothetical protein K474DRAFT_1672541 [Panus rudis PR-1116 ss-1]
MMLNSQQRTHSQVERNDRTQYEAAPTLVISVILNPPFYLGISLTLCLQLESSNYIFENDAIEVDLADVPPATPTSPIANGKHDHARKPQVSTKAKAIALALRQKWHSAGTQPVVNVGSNADLDLLS